MNKDGVLHIGSIVGVHGVKGYLKLYSSAESTGFFEPGKRLYLDRCGENRVIQTVRDIQPYKKGFRIAFEGITDRAGAEALVGCEIYINRSELPQPEQGSWYWCDLIGINVFTTDDAYLGKVEHIFSTGANDVFVVKDKTRETLIPAIESVIREINLGDKKMTVDLPEGL
jgi:16S rRNA processing protein RimM